MHQLLEMILTRSAGFENTFTRDTVSFKKNARPRDVSRLGFLESLKVRRHLTSIETILEQIG